jgi:hypothetical protein
VLGVRRLGLQDAVRQHARVFHGDAVRAAREADILVVCQAPGRNDVTAVAGKTFEYLRSGRPILAIVQSGDYADLVRRHAAVDAIVTGEDPARVADAIADLLDRGACASASIAPDPAFVAEYSRRQVAARIAAIFDPVRDSTGVTAGMRS